MNIILNIIWVVFGGLMIAIEYAISSVLMMVTIIGIPFGLQTMKLALAVRHVNSERRLPVWLSCSGDECNLVVSRRICNRSDSSRMGTRILHHNSRYPLRYAALQTDAPRILPFRQINILSVGKWLIIGL